MRKLIMILFVILLVGGCANPEAFRDKLVYDLTHGLDWMGSASMSSETLYGIQSYQYSRPYTSYHTYGSYPSYNIYRGARR